MNKYLAAFPDFSQMNSGDKEFLLSRYKSLVNEASDITSFYSEGNKTTVRVEDRSPLISSEYINVDKLKEVSGHAEFVKDYVVFNDEIYMFIKIDSFLK